MAAIVLGEAGGCLARVVSFAQCWRGSVEANPKVEMKILVVEDEPVLCAALAAKLRNAAYVVDAVDSLETAQAALAVGAYDAVLLDRRLPDGDSVSILGDFRRSQPNTAIILLTALDRVAEKIKGLDEGADDYLTKPVDGEELLARVRAALRRRSQGAAPPIVCGNVTLEPNHRTLSVFGRPLVLKRRETHLLCALMQRVGRVVERSALLDALYGFDDEVQSNTLDSHVSRLRARLNEMGAGVSIAAVRGVGYVLDARDE